MLNSRILNLLIILILTNPLIALSQEEKYIVNNQEKPVINNNPPIQNQKYLIQNPLPCLDTTNLCVEQLTEKAIANSLTLQTLNERIILIDERLALMGDRKDYAESKLWTNYLPTSSNTSSVLDVVNPFAWIQNLAGGGHNQRDRLAIADLEIKGATLEAARAELERQREQEKIFLGEKVLQLLLSYEAATRQVELVESQIKTFEVSREVFRIRYQFGEGTTEQWLSFEEKENRLNEQLTLSSTKQDEAVRALRQLVGIN
ncbi:hypothetical protein [Crocosphaera sp.]|uniref:hypothetical protein n=1 Tax=Crocosphaera sp. TaxID=2729996 RepID=UPI0026273A15|nr:hypothetical protein [Crocosphaera sp.]MDJ0580960.1 hypothetical protein [Crocosphaera sp.]